MRLCPVSADPVTYNLSLPCWQSDCGVAVIVVAFKCNYYGEISMPSTDTSERTRNMLYLYLIHYYPHMISTLHHNINRSKLNSKCIRSYG